MTDPLLDARSSGRTIRFLPVLSVLALFLAILMTSRADAQILNTLKGFKDDEAGWSGSLDASFAQTGGNTEVLVLSGGATVQYQNERNRIRLLGSGSRTENNGKSTSEAVIGHLRHNYALTGPWHTLVFTQLQRNPFQRLESRFLAGGGFRVDVVERDQWDLAVGTALMFEREEINDQKEIDYNERLSMFVFWSGDLTEATTVDLTGFYQPLIDDFNRHRAFSSAKLSVQIVGSLSLKLSGSYQFNSRPPEGVKKEDWTYLSGLELEL